MCCSEYQSQMMLESILAEMPEWEHSVSFSKGLQHIWFNYNQQKGF